MYFANLNLNLNLNVNLNLRLGTFNVSVNSNWVHPPGNPGLGGRNLAFES